jgi:hypothetical protein
MPRTTKTSPPLSHFRYAILGNGAATLGALQSLCPLPSHVSLDIFSPESPHSYFPAALGKFLKNPEKLEPLFYLTNPHSYQKHHITFHPYTTVVSLETSSQKLYFQKGAPFSYDKLLIATGLSAQAEPPVIPCIHTKEGLKRIEAFFQQKRTLAIEGDDEMESLTWASHLSQWTSTKILYFSSKSHWYPSLLTLEDSLFFQKKFQSSGGECWWGVSPQKKLMPSRKILVEAEGFPQRVLILFYPVKSGNRILLF